MAADPTGSLLGESDARLGLGGALQVVAVVEHVEAHHQVAAGEAERRGVSIFRERRGNAGQ